MNNRQQTLVQSSQQLQTVLNACDAAVIAAKEVHARKVEIAESLFSSKMAAINSAIGAGRIALRLQREELMDAQLKPLQEAFDAATDKEEQLLAGVGRGRRDRKRIEALRTQIEELALVSLVETPEQEQYVEARRAMMHHLARIESMVDAVAPTDSVCEAANDAVMVAKCAFHEAHQAFVAETEAMVASQWPDRAEEKRTITAHRDRAIEVANADLQLRLDRIANHRHDALQAF